MLDISSGAPYDGSRLIHRGANDPDPILIPWQGHSELRLLLDRVHFASYRLDRIAGTAIRTQIWMLLFSMREGNPNSRPVEELFERHRYLSRLHAQRATVCEEE